MACPPGLGLGETGGHHCSLITAMERITEKELMDEGDGAHINHASPGTKIFVYDLLRPKDQETLVGMVDYYSGNEPGILKRDFYNSLLAAFEPVEIARQLFVLGSANSRSGLSATGI